MITSLIYHTFVIAMESSRLLLSENEWHRLKNVGAFTLYGYVLNIILANNQEDIKIND